MPLWAKLHVAVGGWAATCICSRKIRPGSRDIAVVVLPSAGHSSCGQTFRERRQETPVRFKKNSSRGMNDGRNKWR